MMQDNAARKADGSAKGGGLQLVYSRDWSPARRQVALTRMQLDRAMQPVRRKSGKARAAKPDRGHTVRMALGAAAVSGPLLWGGLALLHWMQAL